jgi:alpha-D-xyloside xylohydrolase
MTQADFLAAVRGVARWMGAGAMLAAIALSSGCAATPEAGAGGWTRTLHGVVVTPAEGPARRVRLEVIDDAVIRVTAVPGDNLETPASLMVVAEPRARFQASASGGVVVVTTSRVRAEVSLTTGLVRFLDSEGNAVLAESSRAEFTPTTAEGQALYAVRQQFNRGADEGWYGLGQHQNRQFNYNGEDVELAQHNMDIGIPFLVSTRNYGVLWDNNSITRVGDPRPYQPIHQALTVRAAGGAEGGLTAQYYRAGRLVVTRQEQDVDYQYLPSDQFATGQARRDVWPRELGGAPPDRVVWTGNLEARAGGVHKFRLYASSYFKLYIDDELVLDGWRQNWNPWYRNFDVPMTAGQPRRIRIEWDVNDGYIKLDHLDPLAPEDRRSLSFASEIAHAIDYYYIAGESMDDVISGYRRLTGKAVMLPRWAYGFWQSRQRYNTQAELLEVLREYRRRGIPIDNIVQDWFYWPENAWGSHEFDAARFPGPAAMVREVHDSNAQIMISVWPKFYPTTGNYQELDAIRGVYRRNVELGRRDWVGPGYVSTYYDPYLPQAADIYHRQIRESLVGLGFDGWWLDNDEPDMHSNLSIADRQHIMGPTARGSGAEYFNSFPLVHVGEFHDRVQRDQPDRRQFILTRSGWGGIQRYSSTLWSGDVVARWYDLGAQISAGVNLSMSGIPNWTHDIGGFAVEQRFSSQDPAHIEEWRELYLRWFQFGAFSPLFRAHGEFPYREIYHVAAEGTEVYDSLLYYTRLRYRLMPYIYTIAADTYHRDGTMMRGLVMDFPNDRNVWDDGEEYMFGPAFLVAPVHAFRARTREVYLPAGARWYDFHSGRVFEGGQRVQAEAPLSRMPLFVRAGSIVPIGPAVQYTSENLDGPITLHVYAGADGAFDLYEDDGASNGYQRRQFTRIPIRYDEEAGALTIGARTGAYPGMPATRTFNVRWISGPVQGADDFEAAPDQAVAYDGRSVVVRRS